MLHIIVRKSIDDFRMISRKKRDTKEIRLARGKRVPSKRWMKIKFEQIERRGRAEAKENQGQKMMFGRCGVGGGGRAQTHSHSSYVYVCVCVCFAD